MQVVAARLRLVLLNYKGVPRAVIDKCDSAVEPRVTRPMNRLIHQAQCLDSRFRREDLESLGRASHLNLLTRHPASGTRSKLKVCCVYWRECWSYRIAACGANIMFA